MALMPRSAGISSAHSRLSHPADHITEAKLIFAKSVEIMEDHIQGDEIHDIGTGFRRKHIAYIPEVGLGFTSFHGIPHSPRRSCNWRQ